MQNDITTAQPDFENVPFLTDDDSENVFGSFELEKVVVTTRMLGRTWGAQVLAVVEKESCFDCPNCNELLTHVQIGSSSFDAEVESHFGGEQLLANLVAWHECSDPEDEESA